jgi:hypothetical protein
MDCRVKPGNDNIEITSPAMTNKFHYQLRLASLAKSVGEIR